MTKTRNLSYWTQCRRCRNMFTMEIKAYQSKKDPEWWIGYVEKSLDLQLMEDGAPYCRCGGELRIMGNDIKLKFAK